MIARMSLNALYNYDETLFDGLKFPKGVLWGTVITNLLREATDLVCAFPDPTVCKDILTSLSNSKQNAWQREYDALTAEYEPIENYDRTEEWTDTGSGSATGSQTSSGSSSSNSTNTDKATAFNSYSEATTGSSTLSGIGSNQNTVNSSNSNNNTSSHTGRVHGNIGVTTNQQMISAELALRQNTIYDIIVNDIIDAVCIGLY